MAAKVELLNAIATEVVACRKCHLWKTRKNAVPGEGNPNAQVMFVGEAPGHWEDVKGRPFVGAAGKFLENLLSIVGFSREDVFICNVLKCRPPENREPSQQEIQTCTYYLDRQIEVIKPKVIVTLGNYSSAYIFSKAELPFQSITQTHGKFHDITILGIKVIVFPTFHPAAALYSARYREQITNDFKLLRQKLAEKGIA